ncbi:MAG: NADH-quinone oxidoreductase subunit J [Oligoflexia bacterium]|nr:NADH-quinone oxidoreductase subunit J [Oligoflexia bacterium]
MAVTFYLMAVLLLLSAVAVITFKNPIYSALALVFNLFVVAGLFATLDAHFIAAVQVVVYAGAIMVLVMFVLMLLSAKLEKASPFSPLYFGAALICGLAFAVTLGLEFDSGFNSAPPASDLQGTVAAVGKVLYSRYVFPFEAASLLLMAAIAGAVVLARRRYRTKEL